MYSFFVVVSKKVCKLTIILIFALSNKKQQEYGTPARLKIKKTGLLELQQAKKMRQTLARLPYDAIKQWCQRLRHHA